MADDETFDIGASDRRRPPRVYPRLNRKLKLLFWLAAIGGVAMTAGGSYEYYRARQLRQRGIAIAATLHDSATLATGKGRIVYRLVLDYTPEGSDTTYRKEFVVSRAAFDEALRTGQAQVRFLPDAPQHSAVGPEIAADAEPLAMGAGLLVIAGAIAWYRRRQTRRVDAYLFAERDAG